MRRGGTLVEILVAAPIALGALGLGLVVTLSWLARIAGAAADPVMMAVPVLERLRRDVREARDVVHPRAGEVEMASRGLVLRARDGTLVAWWAEGGALMRGVPEARPDARVGGGARVRLRGVERFAVRRLGGKRALVRVGVLRAGRSVVLLSAAPLAPLAPALEPPDTGDDESEDGAEDGAS